MEYDVFISCKSEDYKYAEEIYDFLRQNGIQTFLASKELRKLGDAEYRRAISTAMKAAYHMIVFASKAEYIDSTWVYYEWDMFVNAKLKGFKQGQILTILKDVNINDINMDLWKYESFTLENYKEILLSYVTTPNSVKSNDEIGKKETVQREKAHRQLITMAEDYSKKLASLYSSDGKKILNAQKKLGKTSLKCPICNTIVEISCSYCPTCGWGFSPIDGIEGVEYLRLASTEQIAIVRKIYKKSIGHINDHGAEGIKPIDLGVPSGILWANKNVGEDVYQHGKLYAWAESESKETFDWGTYFDKKSYKRFDLVDDMFKVHPEYFIAKIQSTGNNRTFAYLNREGTSYITKNMDCAQKVFGDQWTIPQEKHFKELIDNCTWVWVDNEKGCGYWIKGPNGNKIFLPVINSQSKGGAYWSFTLNEDPSSEYANCLFFDQSNIEIRATERCFGFYVRPIATINKFGEKIRDQFSLLHAPTIFDSNET